MYDHTLPGERLLKLNRKEGIALVWGGYTHKSGRNIILEFASMNLPHIEIYWEQMITQDHSQLGCICIWFDSTQSYSENSRKSVYEERRNLDNLTATRWCPIIRYSRLVNIAPLLGAPSLLGHHFDADLQELTDQEKT